MAEEVVAAEVAEAEFARFLDAFDLTEKLRLKTSLDAEYKEGFELKKAVLLLSMRRGHLVVDEKGQPVFTPQLGDQKAIVFKEPTWATRKAMDEVKGDKEQEKSILLCSRLTGQVQARFEKMAQRDVAVCDALAALFFL